MTYTKSVLCQLNCGCMGCCGNNFSSKEKIKEAIKENNREFREANPKTEMSANHTKGVISDHVKEPSVLNTQLMRFRDRATPMDLRNGVCRNLIEKNGRLLCPLHPAQNNGKDLREGHCDINHLCNTSKEFSKWNKEKQERFLLFINKKNLDNLDYSLQIDNGSLLKEFESS